MTLEEYEAAIAPRRSAVQEAMRKPSAELKVDMDEFKGMRTYVRK